MYREIAVAALVAAPLIASTAAHFIPRGATHPTVAIRSEPLPAPAAEMPADRPAPAPATAPEAAPPPAFDGADGTPSLDPVASLDPDAVAASRADPTVPAQTPTPPARDPRHDLPPGTAERY